MTDDKKLPEELGEIDWDRALDEWETKTFVPEVAKDTTTDKPGALAGSSASRPLYRPPMPGAAPPRARPNPVAPLVPLGSKPLAPSLPQSLADLPSLVDDEEGGETLIAAVPRELLRGEEVSPKSASHAGLGQLFAREEKRDASIDVTFEESQRKVQAARRRSEPPEEVVTSAKALSPLRSGPSDPPMRRPSQLDPSERVPDGAMFDPFAEPAPPSTLNPAAVDEHSASPTEIMVREGESPPVGGGVPLAREAVGTARPPSVPPPPRQEAPPSRAATTPEPAPPPLLQATREWPDEKPASAWLEVGAREALEAREAWLEQEARALTDKVARARALLSCSEIAAILGQMDHARSLAVEARDLAPTVALAHRQARLLIGRGREADGWIEALDLEVKMTPAGPARIHSALLGADALRAAGEEEASAKRYDQAARISAADVRAALARAARALSRDETASASLRLPDAPELAPLAEAIAAVLRLRGVERKEVASPGEPSPNEILLRARQAVDRGDLVTAAPLVAQLANVPELADGATWLAASLGATRQARRTDAVRWLRELVERGDDEARRAWRVPSRSAIPTPSPRRSPPGRRSRLPSGSSWQRWRSSPFLRPTLTSTPRRRRPAWIRWPRPPRRWRCRARAKSASRRCRRAPREPPARRSRGGSFGSGGCSQRRRPPRTSKPRSMRSARPSHRRRGPWRSRCRRGPGERST
jgi:hypothetical protein